MKYKKIYKALIDAAHTPEDAAEIIRLAKAGDPFEKYWIKIISARPRKSKKCPD